MKLQRAYDIMKNKEISEVYYNDKPVWIQEINNDTAKIGFLDGNSERDVFITDLYEDVQ